MNLPDHGNLLANIVKWTAKDDLPLQVDGAGLVDCHLYQKSQKLIMHFVNLTSAAAWRLPMDEMIAVGPLKVKVKLPSRVSGRNLRSLVSGQSISVKVDNGFAQFEIRSVLDHEVVVLT
jgi:hypothetical protein